MWSDIYSSRPQGSEFQIYEAQSPFLVHKGDIVTIEYDSLKRRKYPINPVIVRKRNDLDWEDVVNNYKQAIPNSKIRNHVREIFENFAKELQRDPLLPSTWYYLANNKKEIVFPKVSLICICLYLIWLLENETNCFNRFKRGCNAAFSRNWVGRNEVSKS